MYVWVWGGGLYVWREWVYIWGSSGLSLTGCSTAGVAGRLCGRRAGGWPPGGAASSQSGTASEICPSTAGACTRSNVSPVAPPAGAFSSSPASAV